jgi:hypothetical protein
MADTPAGDRLAWDSANAFRFDADCEECEGDDCPECEGKDDIKAAVKEALTEAIEGCWKGYP